MRIGLALLGVFVCSFLGLFSQSNEVDSAFFRVGVYSEGVVEHARLSGITNSEEYHHAIFYSELEQITDIKVNLVDYKGKSRTLKNKDLVYSDIVGRNFFTGYHGVQFEIPPSSHFEITYTRKYLEPILFSSLDLSSSISTRYIMYEIVLGEGMDILFDSITVKDLGLIPMLYESDQLRECAISYVPDTSFSQYSKWNTLRVAIKNSDEYNTFEEAFYSWYSTMTDKISDLSDTTLAEIQVELSKHEGYEEILNVLKTIQGEVGYISIENGLGAFCPRPSDVIWWNRKGDCKDMSFLIKNILESKGIEAYLAISSSTYNWTDMDFPSISSADHMVCVVPDSDKGYLMLDATDSYSNLDYPSTHTQGRDIFILKDPPEYWTVPLPAPDRNLENFSIELDIDRLQGLNQIRKTGYSRIPYQRIIDNHSGDQLLWRLRQRLQDELDKMILTSVDYAEISNEISFDTEYTLNSSKLVQMNGQRFLALSWLPRPWGLSTLDTLRTEKRIGQTKAVRTNLKLSSAYSLECVNMDDLEIDFQNELGTFRSFVGPYGINQLEITYEFICNKATLYPEDYFQFKALNDAMNKFFDSYVKIP